MGLSSSQMQGSVFSCMIPLPCPEEGEYANCSAFSLCSLSRVVRSCVYRTERTGPVDKHFDPVSFISGASPPPTLAAATQGLPGVGHAPLDPLRRGPGPGVWGGSLRQDSWQLFLQWEWEFSPKLCGTPRCPHCRAPGSYPLLCGCHGVL